jgi:hypothetical protein
MSLEFTPHAPHVSTEAIVVKSPSSIKLSEGLLERLENADDKFNKAMIAAAGRDDSTQTYIPFHQNAITAAMLLMRSAVRGAELS